MRNTLPSASFFATVLTLLAGGAISAPSAFANTGAPAPQPQTVNNGQASGSGTSGDYSPNGQDQQKNGFCGANGRGNLPNITKGSQDSSGDGDESLANSGCNSFNQTSNQTMSPEQRQKMSNWMQANPSADSKAISNFASSIGVTLSNDSASWASANNSQALSVLTGGAKADAKISDVGKVLFSPTTIDKRVTTIDARVDNTRPIDAVRTEKSGDIEFNVPVLQCGADGTLRQVASTRMSVPAKSKAGSLSVGIPFVFNIGGSLSVNGTISGEAESVSALGRKLSALTHALAWANMDTSNPTVLLGLDFNYRVVKNANEENDPMIAAYLDAMKKASRVCGNVPFNPPVPPTGNTPPPSTLQACFEVKKSVYEIRTWSSLENQPGFRKVENGLCFGRLGALPTVPSLQFVS